MRIGQLERKVEHLYKHLGIEPPPPGGVSDRVRELVAQGDILQAIKIHRAEAGLDLATAKEQVEQLAR
jgi:hypothetical protein